MALSLAVAYYFAQYILELYGTVFSFYKLGLEGGGAKILWRMLMLQALKLIPGVSASAKAFDLDHDYGKVATRAKEYSRHIAEILVKIILGYLLIQVASYFLNKEWNLSKEISSKVVEFHAYQLVNLAIIIALGIILVSVIDFKRKEDSPSPLSSSRSPIVPPSSSSSTGSLSGESQGGADENEEDEKQAELERPETDKGSNSSEEQIVLPKIELPDIRVPTPLPQEIYELLDDVRYGYERVAWPVGVKYNPGNGCYDLTYASARTGRFGYNEPLTPESEEDDRGISVLEAVIDQQVEEIIAEFEAEARELPEKISNKKKELDDLDNDLDRIYANFHSQTGKSLKQELINQGIDTEHISMFEGVDIQDEDLKYFFGRLKKQFKIESRIVDEIDKLKNENKIIANRLARRLATLVAINSGVEQRLENLRNERGDSFSSDGQGNIARLVNGYIGPKDERVQDQEEQNNKAHNNELSKAISDIIKEEQEDNSGTEIGEQGKPLLNEERKALIKKVVAGAVIGAGLVTYGYFMRELFVRTKSLDLLKSEGRNLITEYNKMIKTHEMLYSGYCSAKKQVMDGSDFIYHVGNETFSSNQTLIELANDSADKINKLVPEMERVYDQIENIFEQIKNLDDLKKAGISTVENIMKKSGKAVMAVGSAIGSAIFSMKKKKNSLQKNINPKQAKLQQLSTEIWTTIQKKGDPNAVKKIQDLNSQIVAIYQTFKLAKSDDAKNSKMAKIQDLDNERVALWRAQAKKVGLSEKLAEAESLHSKLARNTAPSKKKKAPSPKKEKPLPQHIAEFFASEQDDEKTQILSQRRKSVAFQQAAKRISSSEEFSLD